MAQKRGFFGVEAGLLMGGRMDGIQGLAYTELVDRGITRLQDYTLFFVPWISKIAYLYYIFYYLYIYMYIYTYIYIYINKYT